MSDAFFITIPVFFITFLISLIWWCYRYNQQKKLEAAVTEAYRAYAANAQQGRHVGPPPSISLVSSTFQNQAFSQHSQQQPQQQQPFPDAPPSYAEAQLVYSQQEQHQLNTFQNNNSK